MRVYIIAQHSSQNAKVNHLKSKMRETACRVFKFFKLLANFCGWVLTVMIVGFKNRIQKHCQQLGQDESLLKYSTKLIDDLQNVLVALVKLYWHFGQTII